MAFELRDDEALYRVGVNTNCPVHQITLGGQNFTRMSEKVSGYGAETKREPMHGSIVIMQPGQVDKIMEAAKHKLVRFTEGKRARAHIVDDRSRTYRRNSKDVPVGQFVYCQGTRLGFEFLTAELGQVQKGVKQRF